ncbi:MAG: S9 family peptidase [Actinomycetota bacterium]|nr:S9 family peptidase [Actinomycetota bacterium]
MTPEDLGRFRTLQDPQVHPDGRRVAFTVGWMEIHEDRYRSQVWLWDGEQASPFTHGPLDRAPRWSPEGRRLAFLRKGPSDEDRAQVAVLPTAGGEARVVSDFPLGAEELAWSPDGRMLAVVGVDWTEDWAGLEDDERRRRPRRVTQVPWRADNRGWVHDRRRHLYLVDPDGEDDPRLLTPGDYDESGPCWRPDGAAVAFLSARHPRLGLEPGVQPLEVRSDGGEAHPLAERGMWNMVSYRPDGALHLVGQPDPEASPDISSVWRSEDGEWTDLTGELDRSVFFHSPVAPPGPRWAGDAFFATLEDAGRVGVIRVGPDGQLERVVGGDRVVTGADPSPDGSCLAFVATTPTDPGELWWWQEGEERRLTSMNEGFRKEVPLVEARPFIVASDGVDIDAWAYLPRGEASVPLLLNIHGGPATQYGYGFFDEFQVYAGAGYGVVACNPRGSSGRGRDFVRAVIGEGWGVVDLADITAVVDAALAEFPRLDGQRVGVMGGSYGGFMTAWLIGHDRRFSSAVVERALLSWESFSGTSDIGGYFARKYLQADLPDQPEVLHGASPTSLVDRIVTPTLILHSEADYRCPIEQAEQLFMLLRKVGAEVEMVRFPEESHELSRSGKPRHRRERFQIILDWHGRHLSTNGEELAT